MKNRLHLYNHFSVPLSLFPVCKNWKHYHKLLILKQIFFFFWLTWAGTGSAQDNILNFDGGNDFVQVTDHTLLDFGTGDFTVECWVRKLEGSANWSNTYALSKWNSGAYDGTNEWALVLTQGGNNNRPRFSLESGNTRHYASATTAMTIGSWYHLAGVREGGLMKIYVNGSLEGTSNTLGSGAVNNVGRNLRMGTNNNCCGNNASPNTEMELEEVRIWGVARTQAEIQADMNTTISPSTPNLIAYYQFDQGTPCGNNSGVTTVTDGTNGLHGTLSNFSMNAGCISNFASELALPVEWVEFKADVSAEKVILNWTTASETNNMGFEVERSTDGANWQKLHFEAAQGFSDAIKQYTFSDTPPFGNIYFYRLKQLDSGGTYEYSPVLTVHWKGTTSLISIAPNPVSDRLKISTNGSTEEARTIQVYSATGKLVFQAEMPTLEIEINLPHLSSGLYFLVLSDQKARIKFYKK